MAGTPQKLEWSQLAYSTTQWNGRLGSKTEFGALFILRQREHDGAWVLMTSLPAHFQVGPDGLAVRSIEAGKELAEEYLRDFYREMKKHMEPRKTPAKTGGKGGNK